MNFKKALAVLFLAALVGYGWIAKRRGANSDSAIDSGGMRWKFENPAVIGSSSPKSIVQALPNEGKGIAISGHDLQLDQTLAEILASKNDNDPRLDSEFQHLSEGAKSLMRRRYEATAPEALNEKGTVLFLLGQNIATPADAQFLVESLQEPPCRSMEDCSKDPLEQHRDEASSSSDLGGEHHEVGIELTLAYPKVVAIEQMKKYLLDPRNASSSPQIREQLLSALRQSLGSSVPVVRRQAQKALHELGLDR